jgi:hypothetical protein
MTVRMGCDSIATRKWGPAVGLMIFVAVGCGGSSSPAQRMAKAFTESKLQRTDVAKFAGTVTIDSQPPAPFTIVMLVDPKNPKAGVRKAICDKEGYFAFTSYDSGDGVPPGTYVVLFAQFNMGGGLGHFDPPDLMHNLYNDPEKNVATPEFTVTVTAPGKSDYAFNLALAGKEPVDQPGPNAVTKL